MKKVFIGLLAVSGLLASVLVAVVAQVAPSSGQVQRAGLTLSNVRSMDQVRFVVSPLSDCNPGGGGPASSEYIIDAGGKVPLLLSTACNWEFLFFHVGSSDGDRVCSTNARLYASLADADDMGIDGDDADSNPDIINQQGQVVVLSGLGGSRLLSYDGTGVAEIRVGRPIDFICLLNYNSSVAITVPQVSSGGRNVYAGLEFDIDYSSTREDCSSGSVTYVVGDDGRLRLAPGENEPFLVHIPVAGFHFANNNLDAVYDTVVCSYDVGFPLTAGSLVLQASPEPTATVNAGTTLNPVATTASATYAPATVSVNVVAKFPNDIIFPTNEKVAYQVEVVSPCGSGFVQAYPSEIASDGEFAEVQAFAGPVHVFGSELNSILRLPHPLPRSFVTSAFADTRGEQPCSVKVSELSAPTGCEATSEVQTQTYVTGVDALLFEFAYTCGGDDNNDASGDNGATTPPVPTGPPLESPTG